MIVRRIIFFCAISAMAIAQTSVAAPQQTLVPIDGFPTGSWLNSLQQWLNIIQPTRVQVTTPASPIPPIIEIANTANNGGCGGWCSGDGVILAPAVPVVPSEIGNWADGGHQGLTHEMMHQYLPQAVFDTEDVGLHEGLAGGKTDLIYLTLRNGNPTLFPVGSQQASITEASVVDMFNNRRLVVYGGSANIDGSSNFYANVDNSYDSPTALLCLAINKMGGDYRTLDAAINAALPKTRDDFLATLEKTSPFIDGVRPSTFMRYDVTNFTGAPVGAISFGIRSAGGSDTTYQTIGSLHWPFNPTGYYPAMVQFKITADGMILPSSVSSPGNTIAPASPVAWFIHDAMGNLMASRTSNTKNTMVFAALNSDLSWGDSFYVSFPEGAYLVNACITDKVGSTNCLPDPAMNDSDVTAMLGGEELSPGDVAVIANGSKWGQLSANIQLTVISPAGLTIEHYPGLYIFRHLPRNSDGSFQDVTVTDGTYVRTFTPDRLAPTMRYFHRRDEPILQALTLPDLTTTPTAIVPGSPYIISGYGLTQNDPWITVLRSTTEGSGGTPTNDQGRTEVVFSFADGTQYKALMIAVSQTQITFIAPAGGLAARNGDTATITVVLNGTVSMQSMQLPISTAPPSNTGIGQNRHGIGGGLIPGKKRVILAR